MLFVRPWLSSTGKDRDSRAGLVLLGYYTNACCHRNSSGYSYIMSEFA